MSRRGLIVVRNGVTHDARVLREAAAMHEAGLDPLIVGVQTTTERRRSSTEGGFPVLRLDPMALSRRVLRRLRTRAAAVTSTSSHVSKSPPTTPDPTPGHRARLRRLLVGLDFYRQAIGVVRRERPAVVHCNDHNTMWVGVAARLAGARVIYDSHELWPDRNGRPEWRPALIAGEALFVRAAHRVITTSPGYADVLAARYRVGRPELIRNTPSRLAAQAPVPAPGRPVAVYVGGLIRGRGLEQAIDVLARLPQLRLRLIGPGRSDYRAELLARAEALGVAARLELREPVAPELVVQAVSDASVGLALIQPVCLSYELTLPNKLFEYAAAGIPMVVSDLPVMAALVREWSCGILTPPADLDAIARAVHDSLVPERREELARGAARLGSSLTWEDERARLISVYRRLV